MEAYAPVLERLVEEVAEIHSERGESAELQFQEAEGASITAWVQIEAQIEHLHSAYLRVALLQAAQAQETAIPLALTLAVQEVI